MSSTNRPTTTVALAYPNPALVGMADPGFEALIARVAALPDLICERFFLRDERPPDRRLFEFDILAFFLSSEGDFLNVLQFLQKDDLPLLAHERQEDWPLVALAGPCAIRNPEPLAAFVDLVFLDDESWNTLRLFRPPRRKEGFLERALESPGIYIPRLYKVTYQEDGTIALVVGEGGAPLPVNRSTVPRSTPTLQSEEVERVSSNVKRRTVAVEVGAGTERLRRMIGVHLDEQGLFDTVDQSVSSEATHLRLSFWIGLPTETDDDVQAIPELTKRIKHRILQSRRDERRLGEIVVSLRTFIPRAWTVFQWIPMAEVAVLEERVKGIERALRFQGIRVGHDVLKWAYLQAVLARADRRASVLLCSALAGSGDWKRAFREWFLNPDFFALRKRPLNEVFPWDHLWTGKDHLVERYRGLGLG
ncbi:MAG: hypothetical protein HY347_12705 [candidate division NC10 bacterium]|nr:hypothetical protein [candidate division NC10 bacterium]